MHLLSHVGSGICLGYAVAYVVNDRTIKPIVVAWLIVIGAGIVDVDGITLFFSKEIFYSQYWFSHRGAFHSIIGAALLSMAVAKSLAYTPLRSKLLSRTDFFYQAWLWIWLGALIHLAGDLPTPAVPWNGIPLFWPISDARFGGWNQVWWVNEYLMVILTLGATTAILAWPLLNHSKLNLKCSQRAAIGIIHLVPIFIATRFILVSKFTDLSKWQEYQKSVLGENLYHSTRYINAVVESWW